MLPVPNKEGLLEARSISVNREREALDSLMVLAVEGAETSGTLAALTVFVAGDDTGIPPLGTAFDAGIPPLIAAGFPSFVATSLTVLLFFSRLSRSFIDE